MEGAGEGFADRFAAADGVAYLNAAAQGALPLAAVAAGEAALRLKARPWTLGPRTHVDVLEDARGLVARLLGARPEEVALVTGAGAVVNAVARGLALGPGDEVLLAPHEFPSNDLPWRALARRGVTVRVAPPDDPATGALSAAGLAAAVGPRTRVVAFSQVSYLHGGRIDPAPVVAAARAVDALTVVDGSQAAGALPFDFAASGADVYAASGYKYLLGPYGCGVGLFSARALERVAPGDVSWWAVRGADDLNHLPVEVDFLPGARRWDAHEPAAPAQLMPLAASLRLLLEVTPARVEAHARALGDLLLRSLPPGLAPASPLAPAARSHLLCLRAATPAATARAHERLSAAGVVTALRGDRIRVAPHLYNGPEDVGRLVDALR